ncbi:histidine kinase, partial [Sphingobacterium populi]|uniref:histidine kinase n=1 Tax=Sphingobacterium sp. CFCC 11742 TaxID=1775560 RepID=UPI000A765E66
QLSDFLRGTLRKDEKQFILLEDELKHLRLYLDIEKVRFGHRLKTIFSQTNRVSQNSITFENGNYAFQNNCAVR